MNGRSSTFLSRAALAMLFALVAHSAAAQLDDRCTVSVLNRSVVPDATGAWLLTNVPSNFGLVRARATCVQDGVTRFGQSGLFAVQPDGAVSDIAITFDAPVPVPGTLTLTAPTTALQKAGDTTQITITAAMADGTSKDITADPGTTYRTTNPNVATVSPTGLVSAAGSGVVLISVTNDGALGVMRISVAGLIDSDGDGMPDDWEIANGLNPNDPSDAALDPDGDGLTNLQEYQLGTNPHLADTDGDGINDGLEVRTGSNPLDPNSYNLAAALRDIRVNPPGIILVINSIVGSASRTVQVVGDLIDGSTIDLTARSRGTSYTIANPSVAAITPVDGQISAVSNGGTTLTVSNSGFSAGAPVVVSSFSPIPLSMLNLPGYANSVRVAGNFCYVAAGAAGLQIVDVTDRRAPHITGAYDTAGNADDVRVAGTTAYVADGTSGLVIVNAAVPSNPALVSQFNTGGEARALVVAGGRAYIANGSAGLAIVDVSNPAAPQLLGRYSEGSLVVRGVDVQNGLAVLATSSGIRVLDVSNPAAPLLRGSLATTNAQAVKITGSAVLVADYTGSLVSIDISNPSAPALLGATGQYSGGTLNDVDVVNDFAFGADVVFVNGVPIMYVANPASLQVRGRLDFPPPTYRDDNGMGIAADGTYLYLVAASGQLTKPGTSGTTALYIGQYFSVDDPYGIAPRATLTAPAAGSSFLEGTTFTMTADASDDVGVGGVSFFADDKLLGTVATKPYSFTATATVGATTMKLRAQAIDFGGNIGNSADVIVNVTKDSVAPTIYMFAPYDGQRIAAGKVFNVSGQSYDFQSGIGTVDLLVNGVAVSTLVSPYYFTIPYTMPSQAGTLTFALRATDRAGNVTTTPTATVTVFIDQPPSVSFTVNLPASGVVYGGATLQVAASATDDIGVSKLELLVDSVVVKSVSGSSYTFTMTVPTGVSTTTVAVRATDTVGQTALSSKTLVLSPTFALSSTLVGGYANAEAVQGNYAYVAAGAAGLQILDIHNLQQPSIVSTQPLPGNANGVVVRGNWAFVAAGTAGLQVVSVADPLAPFIAGSLPLSGIADNVTARNGRVYVTDELALNIIDVSNPRVPRLISRYAPMRGVAAFAIDDAGAMVLSNHDAQTNSDCFGCHDAQLLDLSDETSPRVIGSVKIRPGTSTNVTIAGTRAYVAGDYYIYIVDIGNPSAPVILGQFDLTQNLYSFRSVNVVGDLALSASADYNGMAEILSISPPNAMAGLGGINFGAFGTYFGTGITATPELVFTSGSTYHTRNGERGTTEGPSAFYIGQYRTIRDTAGVAPQATIDAPAAGATVLEHAAVPIRVRATDDFGVKSVAISVDNQVVATLTTPPFEILYDANLLGTHTISATALDYAGNSSAAATGSFNVVSDTAPPAVRLVTPRDGEAVLSGALRITADASDDFSVAKVEIFANGTLIGTRTALPYQIDYSIPSATPSVTIVARATDPAGHTTDSAPAVVTSFSPATVSVMSLSDSAKWVDASGSTAYVALAGGGVQIVDITDPANPRVVNTVATAAHPKQVRLLGSYIYVAEENAPYEIFDVGDPAAPLRLGSGLIAFGVAPTNTLVYASVGCAFYQQDASNPAAPATLAREFYNCSIYGALDALGSTAAATYTDSYYSDTHTLNGFVFRGAVTNGVANMQIGPFRGSGIGAIRARDNYIAVASSSGLTMTSVTDHFLWNTYLPVTAMAYAINGSSSYWGSIDIADHYLAVIDVSNHQSLMYDVTAPRDPQTRTTIGYSAGGVAYAPTTVALTPTLLLSGADGTAADGTAQHRLFITQYRKFADSHGVAPTATLTTPVAASTAKAGRLLNIQATATDDVAVAKVIFSINGTDICVDGTAPYETNYLVPTGVTSVTVGVRAVDYGGNVSPVTSLTVPVTP